LNRIPLLFTISILVLGLIPFYAADAVPPESTLYMVSKGTETDQPSQLWILETTGDAHPRPFPVGNQGCTTIEFHPVTRILVGLCERSSDSDNNLITIDPSTGARNEDRGLTGFGPDNFGGGSFRNSDGQLFGFNSFDGDLGTFNLATGAFTEFAGPDNFFPGNALAWTPDSSTLYRAGTDGTDGTLDTLNSVTGAVMSSVALDYTLAAPLTGEDKVTAMDYDPDTGTLWAAIKQGSGPSADTWLATIDPSNGAVDNEVLIVDAYVVTNAVIGVDGIAWLDEIPVGGELLPINTAALLLAGLQLSAVWLIPFAVSAIGIGAVLIRKKSSL